MPTEWAAPAYERREVDRAGKTIRDADATELEQIAAFAVVDNWRAAHAFPLNTFQVILRNRARRLEGSATVAQRLKRVPSIIGKLNLQPTMRLSQMQDIGGCRAVMRNVAQAQDLRNVFLRTKSNAEFINARDYIEHPRATGYRSIHLIYKYNSGKAQKRAVFNGLQVEIQVRSLTQHAWATAVETTGLLTSQALKSSKGEVQWLELFCNISSLFAYAERTPPVDGSLPRPALVALVREQANDLRLLQRLRGVRDALKQIERAADKDSRYFLMALNTAQGALAVRGFRDDEIELATESYTIAEERARSRAEVDVVLVRADSVRSLRKAYPNYFLDTEFFLRRFLQVTGMRRAG